MSQVDVKALSTSQKSRSSVNFSDGNRDLHLQALYQWLPTDLRDGLLTAWAKLPSKTIGYLVNTVGDNLFAGHIALALASAAGPWKGSSLKSRASLLYGFLCSIQQISGIQRPEELTKEIWQKVMAEQKVVRDLYYGLKAYKQLTEGHLPDYLDQLTPRQRVQVQPYLLPQIPHRLWAGQADGTAIEEAGKRRRKEKSDVLTPLHHLLVALVHLRKQAAERMVYAFRAALEHAQKGNVEFPFPFSYEEELVIINRNARTVTELCLEKRQDHQSFLLWDRCSWVLSHPDEYHDSTKQLAKQQLNEFAKPQFFVQFLGPVEDLLWFGDIIKYRLHQMSASNIDPSEEQQRKHLLRELGVQYGLECRRPGWLTPAHKMSTILSHAITRSGALLFEPESLYRAILYGATLATIALTNGSRMTELLQVSADRFKMHTYEVKKGGQSTGEQRVIRWQLLLPKGKKTEEERKLFLISDGAYGLLREIAQGLREVDDGHIPVVLPHANNAKVEDLKPERYLFQWAASSDGRYGALGPADVASLLRFVLYGLQFRTKQGEPFTVSVHLLRHVMATVARHEHEVPVEAVAYALHHTSRRARDGSLSIPPATEYYTEESEEKVLMAMASFHTDLEAWVTSLEVGFPDAQTFDRMDEDLRDVFERWQTLLETTLGFCGNANLCPRGYNRTLCIGCPYLVLDPRKRSIALPWRTAYVKHAEELEKQCNAVDARQYHLLFRDLDEHLANMDLLKFAMEDGGRTPLFLQLPSAPYDEVITNE